MTAALLRSFSCQVQELPDGLVIEGQPALCELFAAKKVKRPLPDEPWRRSGDHRIAMSGTVLDYCLSGEIELSDEKAIQTSFPAFGQCLQALSRRRDA